MSHSRHSRPRKRLLSAAHAWWAAPAAFLATVMALPVNATIVVPDEPLTTGNRVAPNILFILDDSGSMAFDYMPDEVPATTSPNIANYAYTRNTLYYNPAVTYLAWMQADGELMTGGTSYDAVFGSFNKANTETIDLGSAKSCRWYNMNTDATNDSYKVEADHKSQLGQQVCGGVQPFFVPTGPTADLGKGSGYHLYQIMPNQTFQRGSHGPIIRSGSATITVTPAAGTAGSTAVIAESANVTADWELEFKVTATTNRQLVYRILDPDGVVVCEGTRQNNAVTCRVNKAKAGKYKVAMWRGGGNNATYSVEVNRWNSSNRCEGDPSPAGQSNGYINCATVTSPWGRSDKKEAENYATWFSYHRTRMKAAKAGASAAFRPLGNRVRVGYRSIWERKSYPNSKTSFSKPIPVDDGNDGRFVNNIADTSAGTTATTTRNDWYAAMQGAIGQNGTPLHGALDKAGAYFSGDAATGAYGPNAKADQYSCRQNFAILTSDGYWNNSSNYDGSLNKGTWYNGVGEQDNSDGAEITGPKGRSYTYNASSDKKWPYVGTDSGTLADVAMKYWKTDLREDLANNVPTTDANPGFWQHMVTFGISIGLSGTRGWKSVEEAKNATTNTSWPNPNDTEDSDRIDDLLHAAVNGRGAFVSASSPNEFTAGLTKALAAILQRTSSFSNVATNAASIRQGGKVFNANYVSGLWTGAVKAWNLDSNNNPAAQAWEASIPAFTSRKVYTFNGSSGTAFPTTAQEGLLLRTGGPVDYPVSGSENANYIKGDASKEERNGGLLRNRTTVLGDIVGSSPAYVDDTKTLYVGANDGMLHAFNADTGVELFAYVPSMINFNHLATLSRGDYEHRWFVDGPVVVSDRKLTPGKNLLVGALGRGGKGLFGLDVSSPATFGAGNVKWELRDTPGNHMGLVTGRPILTRLTDGTKVAILGNGINSTNHKAVLLVINIETGAVVREYDTGAGSSTAFNGLSAPTATLGPDGRSVQYAYAGDRLGNVWKFDLTKAANATGAVTKLFTAKSADGTGAVQPITGAVTVATDPRTYKRWVLFGTGSFVTTTEADDKTANKQSLYGFIDDNAEVAYSDLQKRNIINTGQMVDGYPVRSFEAQASLPTDKKGWFVNLPGAGERVVQDSQVVANILLTASMIPEGDACEASGSGYINAVDAFTGTSAGKSFFDLDGDGDTTDTMIGGVPVGSVNFGVGMPTLPIILDGKLVVGGTGGSTGSEKPGSGGIIGMSWNRVSWREIRAD